MALDSGISIHTFWDSSLYEILDMIKSHERRKTRERKTKIIDNFIIAKVTAANIVSMFFPNDKLKDPKPWDYYEKLFAEEKEISEKIEQEMKFREYQARRKDYFDEINRRRQQGNM